MASESLYIRIINWEKYQGPSKKYERTNWYRQENQFHTHALWELLSPSELKFTWFLFQCVSNKNHRSGEISTSLRTMSIQSGVRLCSVRAALVHLATHGVIEYQVVKCLPRGARVSLRYETERNVTNERLLESSSEPETEKPSSLPPGILDDVRQIQKTGKPKPKPNEVNDETETP